MLTLMPRRQGVYAADSRHATMLLADLRLSIFRHALRLQYNAAATMPADGIDAWFVERDMRAQISASLMPRQRSFAVAADDALLHFAADVDYLHYFSRGEMLYARCF